MNYSKVALRKVRINLGSIANFTRVKDGTCVTDHLGVREVSYFRDNIVENFPLLFAEERLRECNEINLYLIQRFLGDYALQKNKREASDHVWSEAHLGSRKGKPIDLNTVVGIAKDLKAFLHFVAAHNYDYLEVIAAPLSKSSTSEAVAMLPIWQYQAHLCGRVESNATDRLSFGVARRRLRRVREFYVWSYKRGLIDALPFSFNLQTIGIKKKSAEEQLFELPTSRARFSEKPTVWISNLDIPTKLKRKEDKRKGLQPYNAKELTALLSTEIAQGNGTYSVLLKCAYLGGLRSSEPVQINYKDISNPIEDASRSGIYHINIVRKQHQVKTVKITSRLMQALFQYTQTSTWKNRRKKHETKYGMDNDEHPLPLFINSSGERMAKTTASDAISKVRAEQLRANISVLARSYHDLRATFGTYLAMTLIDIHGDDTARVRSELRKWMGHEDFSTTESYIDFAKVTEPNEYGAMHDWVDGIYEHVRELKQSEVRS